MDTPSFSLFTENAHTRKHRKGVVIESFLLFLWGILFLTFPLIISTHTTNAFLLPKQFLLLGLVLLSLFLWGIKILLEGTIQLRRTPFDLPVLLFTIIIGISSVVSINRSDALPSFAALLSILLAYFIIVNIAKQKNAILFLLSALLMGGVVLSILTIAGFFKIYLLPFSYAHNQSFTLLGSYVEQALYLGFLLPIAVYISYPLIKGIADVKGIIFSIVSLVLLLGLVVTIVLLATTQRPAILPFETGFQIAFAAISQDAGRIFQGFFFGSGFGTFGADFSRFKLAAFNLNPQIWYLTFGQSSSLILELLATIGIAGLFSFLFIIFKIFQSSKSILHNPVGVTIFLIVIASFALPFGFSTLALFFFLLAIFAAIEAFSYPKMYYDLELQAFALKRYVTPGDTTHTPVSENGASKLIALGIFIIIIVIDGVLGYFGTRFFLSDLDFQNSLIAASQNNGIQTYNYQIKATQEYPYRDLYYRSFSQTNLALANSLVVLHPKDKKLTDQEQKTLYALIQQSITSGRNATTIAPLTVANWQNLSSIYRALIGFGQNAEQFALLTNQQAVALDSTNPQEYIALGGLYYQLQQYDNAINEFQTAAKIKPDLANAYYNWGHALELKGDLTGALNQYQTVKTLVANDPTNTKKISDEISLLQKKVAANTNGQSAQPVVSNQTKPAENKQPLGVNVSPSVFPTRNPQVKIPAPSSITPVPSKSITPTPAL